MKKVSPRYAVPIKLTLILNMVYPRCTVPVWPAITLFPLPLWGHVSSTLRHGDCSFRRQPVTTVATSNRRQPGHRGDRQSPCLRAPSSTYPSAKLPSLPPGPCGQSSAPSPAAIENGLSTLYRAGLAGDHSLPLALMGSRVIHPAARRLQFSSAARHNGSNKQSPATWPSWRQAIAVPPGTVLHLSFCKTPIPTS